MHLVTWDDIGTYPPKDMIEALGWCKGGNGYAFLHKGEVVAAGSRGTLVPIPPEEWGDWKEDLTTLIQRGVCLCDRPRIVLLEKELEEGQCMPHAPKPRVLLPYGRFDTKKNEFTDLKGVQEIWNGPPPPWCMQVVQVLSDPHNQGWIHLKEEEINTLWKREHVSTTL